MDLDPKPLVRKNLAMPENIRYRPDIDGLRAIAVLMVVVFHTFPKVLPGGFVGVDVFFVISGYLISGHISKALQEGQFSFLEFYAKRCRRILPALLFVLGCVWVLGRNVLLPNEFSLLGKHIFSGAGFFSNVTLYREVGYFDVSANLKPLLHLWSLAIEEQFYIIWPFFLFACISKRKNFSMLLFPVLLLSFSLNVFEVFRDKSAAFYLLPFRFWELLIGAGLAELESKRYFSKIGFSNLKSFLAVALLAFGGFYLRSDFPFPGVWALVPTIAAFLFISAGPIPWLNKEIFSRQPFVNIGRISYPLYLWHWPLLSFLRITSDTSPSQSSRALILLLSFLLAEITHYAVEKPAQRFPKKLKKVALVSFCVLALVGALGLATWRGNLQSQSQLSNSVLSTYGLNGRAEELYWEAGCFAVANDRVEKFTRNHCDSLSFPGRPTLYLLGDSHSAYLSQGLRPFLKQEKINLEQYSAGWCTPLNTFARQPRCAEINKYILNRIKQNKPEIVLFFANYQQYPEKNETEIKDYESFISAATQEIEMLGVAHLIVLGQIPTWSFGLPTELSRRFVLNRKPIPKRTYEGINPASLQEDKKLKGLHFSGNTLFISLRDHLCTEEGCLTSVGSNYATDLLVFDYGHLTPQGAKYVTEEILSPVIKKLIPNSP